jgi:ABC-type sugar transport system ATPase subunit
VTGGEVVAGIRPEHVRIEQAEPGVSAAAGAVVPHGGGWTGLASMRVRYVEPLGSVTHIHLVGADGARLAIKAPAEMTVRPDQRVTPRIDATQCHYFSADGDGRRMG